MIKYITNATEIDDLSLIGWYFALIGSLKDKLECSVSLNKYELDILRRLQLNHNEFVEFYNDRT